MTVAPLLRVSAIGYQPVMDEAIEALQRVGVLEVAAHPFDLPEVQVKPDDSRLHRLDEMAADATFVRDFLGRYHASDQPFSAFISEKFHLSLEQYLGLEPDAQFEALYHECVHIADCLAAGEREIARLRALIRDLEPWRGFHLEISRWRGTEHVALFTGTLPASVGEKTRQLLRDAVMEVTVEEYEPVGPRIAWVVMAHRSELDRVRSLLAATEFAEVSFPDLAELPEEEYARATARIGELEAEAEDLSARAEVLAEKHYAEAFALVEKVESERDALLVRRRFACTDRAFVITGWIRESGRDELERSMEPFSTRLDLTLEPAQAEDHPPVELDNPRWLKPFEVLTDLYGRPRYDELDPTILLAPFFLVFFAICIGDVGYGAMLIVGSWLIKTRLDVAPGVKKFLGLLMWGGLGAMVAGVLFGSYFALPIDVLPPFLANLQLLDPLNQLVPFLLFTIALGVIQVFFGVFVAAYDAWRRGDPAEAIFGQLSTVFLFAMIGVAAVVPGAWVWALPVGLGLTMLAQGRALESAFTVEAGAVDKALYWLWLAVAFGTIAAIPLGFGWVAIVFVVVSIVLPFVSKTARAGVLGFLGGAYAVYGMSAFIGDILSYTRLAALGLSGTLVGMVFNLLAGLVMEPALSLFRAGGLSIAWGALIFVAVIAIFVVGHVFNVVINLLGAFVHPARLQFVEFFSKFYEAGGTPMEPFGFRTRRLVLDAGDTGRKGGTPS